MKREEDRRIITSALLSSNYSCFSLSSPAKHDEKFVVCENEERTLAIFFLIVLFVSISLPTFYELAKIAFSFLLPSLEVFPIAERLSL